eukprot:SAG25_NODE_22_length_22323_cov_52.926874_13_plen_259_part_00
MSREGFACPNPKCLCKECTCGDGCTCGVSIEVTCDPCVAFKQAKMAEKATAASCATQVVIVSSGDIPSAAPEDGSLLVCYWNIRGLGQPIRLALEYCGAPCVDVRVEAGEPGQADYKQFWMGQKASLKLPFGGNLPYMIDGDVHLVQSNAILRYVGRKYGLAGDGSAVQTATLDMLLDQLTDYDDAFTGTCYRNWANKDAFLAEKVKGCLAGLAGALGDKPFLVCDTPTVPDFKAFELLLKYTVCAARRAQNATVALT